MTLYPMYDIAIFGENARLFKKDIYILIKTTMITKIQNNVFTGLKQKILPNKMVPNFY